MTNASNTDPRITVYRVVDAVELAHLQLAGTYGSNLHRSGKYFAFTEAGARRFANAPMNAGTAVTATTLPQSALHQGFHFIDPGIWGAGPSVFYSQPQLPSVYNSMTPPVVLPMGHEP